VTPHPEQVAALVARLEATSRVRLGRSLALFLVPTGGCGGCEHELAALEGIAFDLEQYGLHFVRTPMQADVLLATGPLTTNMEGALAQAYAAMPEPKWVVAVGDCAIDGGVFRGSYAVRNGVGSAVPVDLLVRGCPPPPGEILAGLLALLAANALSPSP
jgi:Ni,Fe-hydrogenase III small subunit